MIIEINTNYAINERRVYFLKEFNDVKRIILGYKTVLVVFVRANLNENTLTLTLKTGMITFSRRYGRKE